MNYTRSIPRNAYSETQQKCVYVAGMFIAQRRKNVWVIYFGLDSFYKENFVLSIIPVNIIFICLSEFIGTQLSFSMSLMHFPCNKQSVNYATCSILTHVSFMHFTCNNHIFIYATCTILTQMQELNIILWHIIKHSALSS